MDFSLTACAHYDIVSVRGEMTTASLITVSPRLSRHVDEYPGKDLVIDLSGVNFLESAGLRLLVNLKKRTEQQTATLYLLKPSAAVLRVLEETRLDTVLTRIEDLDALESMQASRLFERYRAYTRQSDGLLELDGSCSVCGSCNLSGYLFDHNRFEWHWIDDNVYPTAVVLDTGEAFDLMAAQPIVCNDCFFTSTDISHFSMLEEKKVVIKSSLTDNAKHLLAKGIKKRRKIIEGTAQAATSLFVHPRGMLSAYHAYILAELCTRTISVDPTHADPFAIGYLNYCAIRYAEQDQKAAHIDSCRTWLTQALNVSEKLTPAENAICYFILMVAAVNVDKPREASDTVRAFEEFIDELPRSNQNNSIGSPQFWYEQAQKIWNQEISDQSRVFGE